MTETNWLEHPPSNAATAQQNPFAAIHKSIRFVLADVLVQLGCADFTDPACVTRVNRQLEEALVYCERHLEHEEAFVRPACEGKLTLDVFDRGHPTQIRLVAELRAQMAALGRARQHQASNLGQALYLHFSVFVADCLEHMAEEERVLAPMLCRALSLEEQAAILARIARSQGPAEMAKAAYLMLLATNPAEQRALVERWLHVVPRVQVLSLIEQARPRLATIVYHDLVQWVKSADSAA